MTGRHLKAQGTGIPAIARDLRLVRARYLAAWYIVGSILGRHHRTCFRSAPARAPSRIRPHSRGVPPARVG